MALTGASPVPSGGCQDVQANEGRTRGHGAEQGLTQRAPAGQCGLFRPADPPDLPVSECRTPPTPAHPWAGSALGCPAVSCVGLVVRTVELLMRPVECTASPSSGWKGAFTGPPRTFCLLVFSFSPHRCPTSLSAQAPLTLESPEVRD